MAEAGRASHLHMCGYGLMTLAWTRSEASKGLAGLWLLEGKLQKR